jgi:hypothetical protein
MRSDYFTRVIDVANTLHGEARVITKRYTQRAERGSHLPVERGYPWHVRSY